MRSFNNGDHGYMSELQNQFIEFALSQHILQFGEFTLKSGRQSPYFFNAGLFYSGQQLSKLGNFYAQTLIQSGIEFDVLFGPAYKGLPLATTTAVNLYQHGKNIDVSFNRKEAKLHGEKGQLIGAPLANKRIVIIDDVITAGTAFNEAKTLIEDAGGKLSGLIIALDRQEIGPSGKAAIKEIKQHCQIPVLSIIQLDDIIHYLKQEDKTIELNQVNQYKAQWGI